MISIHSDLVWRRTTTVAALVLLCLVAATRRGGGGAHAFAFAVVGRRPSFSSPPSSTRSTTSTSATALFGKKGWKKKNQAASTQKVVTGPPLHIEVENGATDAWKTIDIVEVLNRGGMGVLPTESGYGLVTRLDNKAGMQRLLRLQNKSSKSQNKKPLSLLCSNLATIDEYCALYTLPKQTFKILKKNLPGPYTFLLSAKANTAATKSLVAAVNDHAKGRANAAWKRDTLGVRMPTDEVLRYFQDDLYDGVPLLFSTLPFEISEDDDDDDIADDDDDEESAASASRQMYELVMPQPDDWYWDSVDFVVDAGKRPVDGSTVIDLTSRNGEPELVREGLGALELVV